MNLTKESIDRIIREIKEEVHQFSITDTNLERFGNVDSMDTEYLSYVNGERECGYYIKFLALLVQKIGFTNVVELGNREGLSTLAIYDQLPPSSTFHTIDIIEDVRYCPKKMFSDPRVHFVTGDVCDVDIIKKLPLNIDFLFSDTIHYDYQVRDEFAIYQHLLGDVALVAVDDIYVNDKHKFWDELTYPKWDLSDFCHTNGWGLFLYQRKDPNDTEDRLQTAIYTASKIWQRRTYEKLEELHKIEQRTFRWRFKNLVKRIPGVYTMFCKLNNRFQFIRPDTNP